MNTDNKLSQNPNRPHWGWHLLLVVACIFALVALICNDTFVERWFSPDHHISKEGHAYVIVLRYGLLLLAGLCIILWFFRRVISFYIIKKIISRWYESPSQVDASSIIPTVQPVGLQRFLWLFLFLWIVFVTLSLIPGYDSWAAQLTTDTGVFGNLTVVCYVFAGLVAIGLALPYLRHRLSYSLRVWWLLALAAGCLFVAAEETKWGEIYFHYKVVDVIRQINYQHDTSLHNIPLPFIGIYWANKLLQLLAICGGMLLPLSIWLSRFFRRIMWSIEMPLPPWLSQAYFFVEAIIPPDNIIKLQRANIPSELRETIIAIGVAIWLFSVMQKRHKASPQCQ